MNTSNKQSAHGRSNRHISQVANDQCRNNVDKTAVGIDGQFSIFLGVLYQIPHGAPHHADDMSVISDGDTEADAEGAEVDSGDEEAETDIHVGLSVQCATAVLGVFPKPSEGVSHQVKSLEAALGPGGAAQMRMTASDAPEQLDSPEYWEKFPNAECIVKDPLHIPLKTEQTTKEKKYI